MCHCVLAVAQCIVIGPVSGFVCLWVCYHDNSKLRASIFTKLGLSVKVVTISSWLNFGRPVPPGRGSAAGEKFWLRLTRASAQCLRHLHFFPYRCYFVVPCRLYEEAIVTPFAQILHRLRNVRTQYVKLTEYVHEFVNFLSRCVTHSSSRSMYCVYKTFTSLYTSPWR